VANYVCLVVITSN